MSSSDHTQPPLLHFFCQKHEDTWTVHLGPGWVPPPLRPFFDENFESGHVLLDFDYLEESLEARGATCERGLAKNGSVEIRARGSDAKSLARWLGSSLASGLVSR